ncbi:putative cation transporter [Nocardioides baekrokdamisoli]|uniref:Putative cation transporter n=1 Tax=Nocardioides baekrokdamisoli TaxID=1804624 RepID=A0A3G9J032_9ACTN|nr:cation diffusion facilitator family transporter [Nocardioides baekrokdamisoli]BBH16814.1 putative cation transporter [Nocardioides baekrokdamisoli]
MSHDHDHGSSHGHDHGISENADGRYLASALGLLVAYMVGEVVVAFVSHSLALLSDAGHMLTDAGAIGVAIWAMRLAARPARGAWTFGWKRAEILSALANGVSMLVIAAVVAVEAIRRLATTNTAVNGTAVLATALVGVVVNIAAAWLLARANRSSLNVEGAYQHILTDLYGFIGTIIAAAVILTTGWAKADAVASLVVVALMLKASWGLLRDSGRVLLEAAPAHIDMDAIREHLLAVDHVTDVHDLHVWTVTSDLPSLSAHLVIQDGCFNDGHAAEILAQVHQCLDGHFEVDHSTFQLEPESHGEHEHTVHA